MIKWLVATLSILVALGCSTANYPVNQDPYYESFFQKARLIMSNTEIEIYKHLPDNEARREFIENFWEKRDPTPSTKVNENRIEFKERIEYANKWFEEGRGTAGKRRGWNTVRGRIFLQLGHPTERRMGDYERSDRRTGRLLSTKRDPIEIWIYRQYNLVLRFVANQYNEYGFWGRPPAALGRALREAKDRLNYNTRSRLEHNFEFSLGHNRDRIEIKMPVKRISFSEEGEEVTAGFHIHIIVYRDYVQVDDFTVEKTLRRSKEEALSLKRISITLPYTPEKKGKYTLEAVVTEKITGSMYRDFTGFRY